MSKYFHLVSGESLTFSIFYFLQENIHCPHFKQSRDKTWRFPVIEGDLITAEQFTPL